MIHVESIAGNHQWTPANNFNEIYYSIPPFYMQTHDYLLIIILFFSLLWYFS